MVHMAVGYKHVHRQGGKFPNLGIHPLGKLEGVDQDGPPLSYRQPGVHAVAAAQVLAELPEFYNTVIL
jgi:hypothetical protein